MPVRMTRVMLSVLSLVIAFSLSDAGVSYVRWGRTACPDGIHLLYKGFMIQAHYGVSGSGANYLCANEKPQFVNPVPGRQGYSALTHGVEFDLVDLYKSGGFKSDNIPGGTMLNQDMVCAVCYVADSTDMLMMPGRQDCGNIGYDLQYKGYLVSQGHGQSGRGEFVCLDDSPEGRPGGSGDDAQAIIYPVEIGCGSLPCNPYVDGYEMTCAICTY